MFAVRRDAADRNEVGEVFDGGIVVFRQPVEGRIDQTGARLKFLGQLFICYVNPTAHPNVPGADAYRESISDILKVAWSK